MNENNEEESPQELDDNQTLSQETVSEEHEVSSSSEKQVVVHPPEYDTWLPAKKQSWDQMYTNPNAFYFRHRPPGEEIIKGPWSEDEKKLFIEKLRKTPKIGKDWGDFARDIPGRVGYQCRSYFHKLVESGELQKIAPEIQIEIPTKKDLRKNIPKLEDAPQKIYLKVPEQQESKINSEDVKESLLKNADLFY